MTPASQRAEKKERHRNSNSSLRYATSPDRKKEGFLDKHRKLKRIVGKSQALLFIVLNSILPAGDVISDFLTFNELMYSGNPKWAWITLSCIFLPFLFKCCMFFKDLVRGRASLQNLGRTYSTFPAGVAAHLCHAGSPSSSYRRNKSGERSDH